MACTEFKFVSQGAIVQAFPLAGSNIVLGFPDPQLYRAHNEPYFGETIGRVANRIKNAEIRIGQDLKYSLAQNDGPNCLHGGWQGWGKKPFQGPFEVIRDGRQALHFLLVSADGDEGFPGTLECRVWYFTKTSAVVSELEIEYEVEFIGSECDETIVALTNHSYFNLNPGSTTIGGTQVKLGTDWQLEADDQHIPTGDFSKFDEGTAFTVKNATPEIDACFIMDPDCETFALDTRGRPHRRLIQLHHPATNFNLEVLSTEPAFQLYTGDGIDVPALPLADGQMYSAMGPRSGIAIEPCRYVDAQRRKWRAQCSIKPGERWGSRTTFRAWKGIE